MEKAWGRGFSYQVTAGNQRLGTSILRQGLGESIPGGGVTDRGLS